MISSLILVIFIKPLIFILYGIDFVPIIKIVYILVPSLFFKNISVILGCFYSGIGRPIKNVYMQIIPLIIQITLTAILVKDFGYLGVVFSISISSTIYGIAFIFYFLKSTKQTISNLIPKFDDLKYLFSFIRVFNS